MTKQPYLGIALLALERDASRKGEVDKALPNTNPVAKPRAMDLHHSGRNNRRERKCNFKIATWNIRTMLDSNAGNRPRRRSALIDLELENINADITALQEVRYSGEGHLREKGRTFFWRGCPEGQPKRAGVAFAIKNELADKLNEAPKGVSERLMTLRICMAGNRYITIINVYAPTMTYPDQEKEAFYSQLHGIIANVPATDKLVLLGDFNARVGSDYNTWSPALGKFGKGKQNSNGELLTCLCSELELAITNTYFMQPDNHYYSWTHPRSKRSHLLDYIIVRRKDLQEVRYTRAMRGPDCHTDHYLVCSSLGLSIKPMYHKQKTLRKRKLNTTYLKDEEYREKLAEATTAALRTCTNETSSPDEMWAELREATFEAAVEVLGYTKRPNADWFNENDQAIKKNIEERNQALTAKLSNPSASNQEKLRKARSNLQRNLREMENDWWLQKAHEMQKMADTNNSAGFFRSLKEVYGPKAQMSNTLLAADKSSIITEPAQLTQRWREYFDGLLNMESTTEEDALNHMSVLAPKQDMNEEPTITEVTEAINNTKMNKSPGIDGIPAEIYKFGGDLLKTKLHQLIKKCWQNKTLPQEFKDVMIIPIYKNKGDYRDCSNYRGISLLSIAGKIMAKILQKRLSILAETVLTESQCGFRQQRSTIDMIFSLRQLQEKAIEQHRDLYIVFIDFRKAFDTVDRPMLWKILRIFGCPDHFVELVKQFHEGTIGRVIVGNRESDEIRVNHGTKQGCVLAPTLFTLFLTTVLLQLRQEIHEGVFIHTRADGRLFNIARLKAKTKIRKELIMDLLFADDTALVAHEESHIQEMVDCFSRTAQKIGLQINIGKTEVMYQPAPDRLHPGEPSITINGEDLKVVATFKYLGSTVDINNRVDREISCRIQSASSSFGKLEKRLWSRNGIRLETKCKVYKAVVLPALLYSSETYTLYREHIRRLETIQQRHLRRIMKIKWSDHVSNIEVLKRAKMDSIESVLATNQLRWTGHVLRMGEDRIPRMLLYGELESGRRSAGGQKLRYKDVIKRHLKGMKINIGNWETMAANRGMWRSSLHEGKAIIESTREAAAQQRHFRRHNPGDYTCSVCGRKFHTSGGELQHRRRMHQSHT